MKSTAQWGEGRFWQLLKRQRKQQRLTQQQLAEATGCSRQEISLMENGHFRGGFPKVERVFRHVGIPLQPLPPEGSRYEDLITRPARILAIDDDPDILYGHRRTFSRRQISGIRSLLDIFQFECRVPGGEQFLLDAVSTAREGVSLVRKAVRSKNPYALLLMDMRMPGDWDGLQTATEIRALDPNIRIVVLSAFRDYTLGRLREQLGEHFVLYHKPYQQDELLQLATFMVQEWQRAVTMPHSVSV